MERSPHSSESAHCAIEMEWSVGMPVQAPGTKTIVERIGELRNLGRDARRTFFALSRDGPINAAAFLVAWKQGTVKRSARGEKS